MHNKTISDNDDDNEDDNDDDKFLIMSHFTIGSESKQKYYII